MNELTRLGSTQHGNLQKYENVNRFQQRLIQRFHVQIADLIRQTGAGRFLDVGCGEAFSLRHLQAEGIRLPVMGTDIIFTALQMAHSEVLPGLPAAVADIHHLPYPDNAFPLVTCLEVLEHIPDSTLGLRELFRVSANYLLLSVPHEPYFRGANFLRGKHLSRWGNDPEHLHTYSGGQFRQLAGRVVDEIIWHGYRFPWQIILARKYHSTKANG
jgi:SAM-dependent methyltransferase